MTDRLHAFDYLENPADHAPAAVCVVYGSEALLKRLVIKSLRQMVLGDDPDSPYSSYAGRDATWRDVRDELATVSLFAAQGRRLVTLDEADDFVSRYRTDLEDYVSKPNPRSVFLVEVDSWPGNTRLAKSVAKVGLAVDCRLPQRQLGRTSTVDERRVAKWLVDWTKTRHQARLDDAAAEAMLEVVGPELGLLDQELAKLAVMSGIGGRITAEHVHDNVGGWRTKTTWEMLDAAAAGDTAEALRQLDRLLQAGDAPQALFGQISWFFRRFTTATRNFERLERAGRRPSSLKDALKQAGFRNHEKALKEAELQLKKIGRERASRITRWLLNLDLALKGTHSTDHRGRIAIEQFLVRLSAHPS